MPARRHRRRAHLPPRTPAQHVGHHAHRLLVWLGGVAAVVILIAGGGIWRLMQGPIELDRLVPYVQEALEQSGAGLGIAVSGVSIAIDRQTHQLDLRINNVRLALPNGEKIANFPQMATSFSLGALLGGRIEPTRLTVEQPVLLLTRDETGALSFRIGDAGEAERSLGLGDPLGILAPLRPGGPWSQLQHVAVRDATIIIDDRPTGRIWRASRVAATLERSTAGVDGDLSFAAELGPSAPELHATYRYAAPDRLLDIHLAVDGLDPTALAPLAPALAPLAAAQIPVSGTAGVRFDLASNRVESGRVDLGFGAGRLETPLLVSGGVSVASGELHADYAPDTSQLRLEQLALDLGGGTRLVVRGGFHGLAPELVSAGAVWPQRLDGALDVTLSHVPAGRVPSLWPQGVSPGGRRWVAANLTEGMLDEMSVQLGVSVDPAAQSVAFSGAHGTMRYRDLTVDYLDGLPPAKKVSGTATLNDRRLDFTVTGGSLKGLKATGGAVSITDIGAPVETLTVDVPVSGPLQEALDAIDAKPLHYAHDAGIDPARVGGKVDAQLHFKLPLLANLKLDQVDYGAKATLSGVSLTEVALDRNLSDGNLTLDLSHGGVHVQGTGKFDGSPVTLDGNLFFHPPSGPRARYRIGLTLDDAARERLGFDAGSDRLSGPVAADLTYTVPPSGTRAQIDAVLDLGGARLALAGTGWEKPPSVPGMATLTVDLDNDEVIRLPAIEVKAPGLNGKFAIGLSPDKNRVDRVDIHRLIVADNDVSGVVSRRPGGGWRAEIRAERLDLHHALKRALNDDTADSGPPLQIDARVARLSLGPGPRREARDVTAAMLRDGGEWQAIDIAGNYPGGGHLALNLATLDGARRLHVESDNFGAGLSLFGIADNVVGGKVAIDGTLSEQAGHRVLRAHIDGANYNLVRAPVLAQLLSFGSLDALYGMMSGSGVPFTTLRGDFIFSQGRITLDPIIGYGGALGVTAQGWLSPGEDKIDIDGTIAPAYVLNSIVGNLPVIGALLTGGEGQGLFAASFRLTGSNDDPTVSVNPLAALTPGVLRRLFDPIFGTAQMPPTHQAQH
jgi:hypothetical protein